jgi:PAS domain S-box-containing protein
MRTPLEPAAPGPPQPLPPAGVGPLIDQLAAVSFVLDAEGRVAAWSESARRLTGLPAEEAVGAPFTALLSGHAAARGEALLRGLAPGESRTASLPVRGGGGEPLDAVFRATSLRLPDGRALAQIIAAPLDGLRRIQGDRTLLEVVLDQVPAGIAVYDAHRRYLRVNHVMEAYDGMSEEERLGRRIEELRPDADLTIPTLQQHVLDTGESVADVMVTAGPPGAGLGPRYWSVSYSRLEGPDGEVLGLIGVMQDVTDRHLVLELEQSARRRSAILAAASGRVGTSLDFERTAADLAEVAVPLFADSATVYLLDSVADPATAAAVSTDPAGPVRLRPLVGRGRGAGDRSARGRAEAPLPAIEPGTAVHRCLFEGAATLIEPHELPSALTAGGAPGSEQQPGRAIVAPLAARGLLLGMALFTRAQARESFLPADLEVADELLVRAAIGMSNARLSLLEHATAVLLQDSLPPAQVPHADGARIAHRHRPGPAGAEVGGDWFDVITLPGRRIALVLGDVMGSGLSAAAATGQFRTAVRALARLDLSPAALLRELDELADSLTEAHLATCVYAVYDPVSGRCVLASAGHPPPLLAEPRGGVERIELPTGTPLGVGSGRFEEREIVLDPGTALMMYTNGLVENRTRDVDDGVDDLMSALDQVERPPGRDWLGAACDAVFDTLVEHRADDATLLMAVFSRIPQDRLASWMLTTQPTMVSRARNLVRDQLAAWKLSQYVDVAELLVSELVTNALRYGRGPIGLRLLRDGENVVCEVADGLTTVPRLRAVQNGDEGGRGLQLVDQLAGRWGARSMPHGKIVWFELGPGMPRPFTPF